MPLTHDMLLASNRQETYPYIIAYYHNNRLESYYYEPTTNQILQTDTYTGDDVTSYAENVIVSVATTYHTTNTGRAFFVATANTSGSNPNTRLSLITFNKDGIFTTYYTSNPAYTNHPISDLRMSPNMSDFFASNLAYKPNADNIIERTYNYAMGHFSNANTVYTDTDIRYHQYFIGGDAVVGDSSGDINVCSSLGTSSWSTLRANTNMTNAIRYFHPRMRYYSDDGIYGTTSGGLFYWNDGDSILKQLTVGSGQDSMDYVESAGSSDEHYIYSSSYSSGTIYVSRQLSTNSTLVSHSSISIPYGGVRGVKVFGPNVYTSSGNTHLLAISTYNNVLVYSCNTNGYLTLKKDYNAGPIGPVNSPLTEIAIKQAT